MACSRKLRLTHYKLVCSNVDMTECSVRKFLLRDAMPEKLLHECRGFNLYSLGLILASEFINAVASELTIAESNHYDHRTATFTQP